MSRQNKQRNKVRAQQAAKNGPKGHRGASGIPSNQLAPPWVGNGKRKPKAVKEREAKIRAEREAAEREAELKALREAAHEA